MKIDKIIQLIQKANRDFHLIEENDCIAIGVSGGKDSMVLLKALHLYQRFAPISFDIVAIHIHIDFKDLDTSSIQSFCASFHIEYHEEFSDIYEELNKKKINDRLSCSFCSKYRKACMCQAALKYHCNKIAFAHNSDDAVETLFMNMIHGAKISVFQPKIQLEKSQLTLIRPLIYVDEHTLEICAQQEKIPLVHNPCPNDKNSERAKIKKSLNEWYQLYPHAKENFKKMLINEKNVQLWKKNEE